MQKFRPNLLPSDPSFAFQRKFATPIKNLFQRQLGLNFFWRRLVFFASHFHSRKIACSAACACVCVCLCAGRVCVCVCVVCVQSACLVLLARMLWNMRKRERSDKTTIYLSPSTKPEFGSL